MNNKSYIIKDSLMNQVKSISFLIKSVINSFAFLVGIICLNLLDVILGGIILSEMLQDYSQEMFLGISVSGRTLGWSISIALWYIQLFLWDRVLSGKQITTKEIPAITIAVITAVLDTFIDSSSILIFTNAAEILQEISEITFVGFSLPDMLVGALFIVTAIVTGLNEMFNGLIFSGVKDVSLNIGRKTKSKSRPVASPIPNNFSNIFGTTNKP